MFHAWFSYAVVIQLEPDLTIHHQDHAHGIQTHGSDIPLQSHGVAHNTPKLTWKQITLKSATTPAFVVVVFLFVC